MLPSSAVLELDLILWEMGLERYARRMRWEGLSRENANAAECGE